MAEPIEYELQGELEPETAEELNEGKGAEDDAE